MVMLMLMLIVVPAPPFVLVPEGLIMDMDIGVDDIPVPVEEAPGTMPLLLASTGPGPSLMVE